METRDLEFDDDNLDHRVRHGLTERRVFQVLDADAYVILRNKRSGTGQFKMIGPDFGGQIWTIILPSTDRSEVWRPVTGWPATRGEVTVYRKVRS